MKDTRVAGEVGRALCRVCATATAKGHRPTVSLVRAALDVAGREIGGLPASGRCPARAEDAADCPLVRRED